MKYNLDHLEPGDIPRIQSQIKENYSKIDGIMSKLKQGISLTHEDKVDYYTALGSIRYEKWTLRENISKRSCRKMFDGLWRTVILDGNIKIRDVYSGKILNLHESRIKQDEVWDQFLAKQRELNRVN